MDIVIAIIIVAVLGIVVHPVLWFLVILAGLWLFGRHRTRSR